MKKYTIILVMLLTFTGCNKDRGQLIFSSADNNEGFNFPYFLYIPEGVQKEKKLVLIVEPNNSGFAGDKLKDHLEKSKRTATKDFYIGNYIARNLDYPLLVPVFPRPKTDWKIYTHALDRDAILQKGNSLERLDLQLINMITNAQKRLTESGYKIDDKFLIVGFSASGSFANRFSLIHPDKIVAAVAGGVNGLLMLPVKELNGEELDYPLGINDFEQLFGNSFDSTNFRRIPQYLFMGSLDNNDAVPFEDAYDVQERNKIFQVIGEEMLPERWNNCIKAYNNSNVNAKIITYDSIGHEHPIRIKDDILEFLKVNIE